MSEFPTSIPRRPGVQLVAKQDENDDNRRSRSNCSDLGIYNLLYGPGAGACGHIDFWENHPYRGEGWIAL